MPMDGEMARLEDRDREWLEICGGLRKVMAEKQWDYRSGSYDLQTARMHFVHGTEKAVVSMVVAVGPRDPLRPVKTLGGLEE